MYPFGRYVADTDRDVLYCIVPALTLWIDLINRNTTNILMFIEMMMIDAFFLLFLLFRCSSIRVVDRLLVAWYGTNIVTTIAYASYVLYIYTLNEIFD